MSAGWSNAQAQSGVQCPYCRGYVEGYSSLTGQESGSCPAVEASKFTASIWLTVDPVCRDYTALPRLQDANRAAQAAAAQRDVKVTSAVVTRPAAVCAC